MEACFTKFRQLMACFAVAPCSKRVVSLQHTWNLEHKNVQTFLCTLPLVTSQDRRVMDQIAKYFSREISEIEWDDEDTFLKVLSESM